MWENFLLHPDTIITTCKMHCVVHKNTLRQGYQKRHSTLWETDFDISKNCKFPSDNPTNHGHFQALSHLKFICVKHSQCKCQFRQIYACCGLDSQQLQRGQAIEHSAGQLSDLITVQNPAHRKSSCFVLSLKERTCIHISNQSVTSYYDVLLPV